jgi:hypothetical protein
MSGAHKVPTYQRTGGQQCLRLEGSEPEQTSWRQPVGQFKLAIIDYRNCPHQKNERIKFKTKAKKSSSKSTKHKKAKGNE